MTKKQIVEKLVLLNQTQLLKFTDELSTDEAAALLNQIENMDLSVLNHYEIEQKRGEFTPMSAVTVDEIAERRDEFEKLGIEAIRNGKVGAVLLAGGQGSRLGFDHPKGMLNIGVNKDLYIFECLINNLLDVVKKAKAWIPLFIMTSVQNDEETRRFFEEHDYFGYSADNVLFFVQEELPTLDQKGKLMLSEKGKVSTAPNGNGGWYMSLLKSGVMRVIKDVHLEWLNVFSVDNVLQRIADPCFIGAVIAEGSDSGAKVVAKASPEERVGVLCNEDGKPSIVEYYEMSDEMLYQRESDGRLSYNYGVTLNYLFNIPNLDRILHEKLPIHKAFKKVNYINSEGEKVYPEEANAYKFETLVLDMVKLQNSCIAYEVEREKEFAPVKNKDGVDSIDTARELLKKNNVEL